MYISKSVNNRYNMQMPMHFSEVDPGGAHGNTIDLRNNPRVFITLTLNPVFLGRGADLILCHT